MYSFHAMRRALMCSQAWAHSTASTTTSIRSMIQKRGNGILWRPIPFLYISRSHPVFQGEALQQRSAKLLGLQACAGPFLGLWATEQGAVRCEIDDCAAQDIPSRENRQVQDIAELIGEDSALETDNIKYRLLSLLKRFILPTVFFLTVALGYPYPTSLLPISVLLFWSTKPDPATLIRWLKKRSETLQMKPGALDRVKEKIISTATVMHVEVQDYMFFCVAKVTYLTSNATMVGILGDWWVVYSSSSRITALGISLDNVPNLDNIAAGIAEEFRSRKEELEFDFRKAAEDGLKKYKEWIEKQQL